MRLATVKELSEIIKIKEKTLYEWAAMGKIPCLKLNGVLRFDMDDIQRWIQDYKKTPSSGYNMPAQPAGGPREGG